MSQIKKNNFWATFISWFVTFTLGTAVGDYFGLKGRIFSLDTVLRFGIFMIIFFIIQFLVSKVIYVWNKNVNNNK
ncbi:hypothetical protein [Clostridium estertheticum]|uniref:hypothetical protein n=1 Tax=Clostridium estertheticum TaxID=238834 RepID=UPI001C7CB84A|nr:hypothetical protein [Clostridium estertheticum]MBX4267508.1 hypothetical protein [Clostridium estertheticum]WLC88625.1 hypothetical protein KTC95_21990 [Clostridium estertheticum]